MFPHDPRAPFNPHNLHLPPHKLPSKPNLPLPLLLDPLQTRLRPIPVLMMIVPLILRIRIHHPPLHTDPPPFPPLMLPPLPFPTAFTLPSTCNPSCTPPQCRPKLGDHRAHFPNIFTDMKYCRRIILISIPFSSLTTSSASLPSDRASSDVSPSFPRAMYSRVASLYTRSVSRGSFAILTLTTYLSAGRLGLYSKKMFETCGNRPSSAGSSTTLFSNAVWIADPETRSTTTRSSKGKQFSMSFSRSTPRG